MKKWFNSSPVKIVLVLASIVGAFLALIALSNAVTASIKMSQISANHSNTVGKVSSVEEHFQLFDIYGNYKPSSINDLKIAYKYRVNGVDYTGVDWVEDYYDDELLTGSSIGITYSTEKPSKSIATSNIESGGTGLVVMSIFINLMLVLVFIGYAIFDSLELLSRTKWYKRQNKS